MEQIGSDKFRYGVFGNRRTSPREDRLFEQILDAFKDNIVKEYDVTVIYYHNMPSITTEKTVTVDASSEIVAEEKVRKMFPNITSLTVTESNEKATRF